MPTRRRKGTGSVFKRGDGIWLGQVSLTDGTGKRRRKTVTGRTEAEAKRRMADLVKQLEQTGTLPMGQQTLNVWAAYWLEHVAAPRVRPRTLTSYQSHVTRYILPAIGRVRLERVTPQHVRSVHSLIHDRGLSSTTAQHAHVTLVTMLGDAVKEGLIVRNPAALVGSPKRAVSTRGALTAEQGILLLKSAYEAGDPLWSRWGMALLTGQRQGECLGLEADRVLEDRIDVSWQLQRLPHRHGCDGTCGRRRGGDCPTRLLAVPAGFEYRTTDAPGLYLTRPKSKAGWRIIPLVDPLRGMLAQHLNGRTDGLVWTDRGRPVDPKNDNLAWHAALKTAGLPQVTLHEARHTAATLLLQVGVDAHVVAQILGQSSILVARAYQHVALEQRRDAMTLLGKALTAQ